MQSGEGLCDHPGWNTYILVASKQVLNLEDTEECVEVTVELKNYGNTPAAQLRMKFSLYATLADGTLDDLGRSYSGMFDESDEQRFGVVPQNSPVIATYRYPSRMLKSLAQCHIELDWAYSDHEKAQEYLGEDSVNFDA